MPIESLTRTDASLMRTALHERARRAATAPDSQTKRSKAKASAAELLLRRAIGEGRLERGPGMPVWRQIERLIREAIAERRFLPGERLPTEAEFAQFFDVHRHTFRRAIAPLVGEGVVFVRQGQGMTVRDETITYPIKTRTRFSEIVSSQQLSPTCEVLSVDDDWASDEVADALGIPEGTPVVCAELVRLSDGVPVSVTTDIFPAARFEGLGAIIRETGSVSETLAHFGVTDYRRLRSQLYARMPTDTEAEVLRQSAGQPVMCADSVNVDDAGQPVQFTHARFSSPRVRFIVEPDS